MHITRTNTLVEGKQKKNNNKKISAVREGSRNKQSLIHRRISLATLVAICL